jgi:DNA-binding Lrp family transcriptional regulator
MVVAGNRRLKLDRIDVEILRTLQENARIPLKELASKVGLSIPAVRARIDRLVDLGVIKGFTVIVDPSRIAERVRALILCKVQADRLGNLPEELGKLESVKEVHTLAGSYNLALKVELREIGEITRFVHERLSGAVDVEVLIVSNTYKEECGATLYPDEAIRIRCDFCHALIVEKPVIREIGGGRYYFSSEECADAFERKLRGEEIEIPWWEKQTREQLRASRRRKGR